MMFFQVQPATPITLQPLHFCNDDQQRSTSQDTIDALAETTTVSFSLGFPTLLNP